jgi:hypothetical protein
METPCLVTQDIEPSASAIGVLYVALTQTGTSLLLCISSPLPCIWSGQIQFSGMSEKDRWASKGHKETVRASKGHKEIEITFIQSQAHERTARLL